MLTMAMVTVTAMTWRDVSASVLLLPLVAIVVILVMVRLSFESG